VERRIACALLLATVSACGSSHTPEDASTWPDAGRADGWFERRDGGTDTDGASRDATVDSGSAIMLCGGHECVPTQVCCYATGECFDEANPDACRLKEPIADECASNLDCHDDEYCASDACVGIGTCEPRPPAGCGPPVCGCDGNTYPGACDAAHVGVRPGRSHSACGMSSSDPPSPIACAADSHCGAGGNCCLVTSECLPADCRDCCVALPDGEFRPCRTDSDCFDTEYFCSHSDSCGGLGFCHDTSRLCDGVLEPVCGCDGLSYSNRCAADNARTSVAHAGACDDGGDGG
jgi:Kazal-type serine protease inhibitor domain